MQSACQKFVDTNILGYGEDLDDPAKHAIALELISQLRIDKCGAVSIQILNEFSNIVSGNMRASEINERIADYEGSFKLIYYSLEDIKTANHLAETYKIRFYDALIAATMKTHNIDIIITENEKDFKKIPWLQIINPFKKS